MQYMICLFVQKAVDDDDDYADDNKEDDDVDDYNGMVPMWFSSILYNVTNGANVFIIVTKNVTFLIHGNTRLW